MAEYITKSTIRFSVEDYDRQVSTNQRDGGQVRSVM